MKLLTALIAMLLLHAAIPLAQVNTPSPQADKERQQSQMTEDLAPSQNTQALGYWVDPSTGLMWAAKDNGEDITWRKAMKYCNNLRLGGYSDWKLPTIEELEGIYDGSGFNAPHPRDVTLALAGRAKGGLLLTGAREWSSSRVLDDRGHRTGMAWQFDFPHGKQWSYDPIGYNGSLRALCVRGAAN